MHALRNTLYTVPHAFGTRPPLTGISSNLIRNIRIKSSENEDRPREGHVLERKDRREGSLDPQAQNAKGSMGAPLDERPAYVHGRVNRGDAMGGASTQGKEEAAAPSWWVRLKQRLGFGTSNKETKHGGQSGNR